MVSKATTSEVEIPAEYKTITKRILVSPADMGGFVEVDCGSVKKVSGSKIADYSISDIQNALIRKGDDLGSTGANNEFNEVTRVALLKFQKARGISVGGFNAATIGALGMYKKAK